MCLFQVSVNNIFEYLVGDAIRDQVTVIQRFWFNSTVTLCKNFSNHRTSVRRDVHISTANISYELVLHSKQILADSRNETSDDVFFTYIYIYLFTLFSLEYSIFIPNDFLIALVAFRHRWTILCVTLQTTVSDNNNNNNRWKDEELEMYKSNWNTNWYFYSSIFAFSWIA